MEFTVLRVCKQVYHCRREQQYWKRIVFLCNNKTLLKCSVFVDICDVFSGSWVSGSAVKPSKLFLETG